MGDRAANIKTAVHLLHERGMVVLKCSTVIESDPVGGPAQNKFLNAVVKVETNLSPAEVLSRCQSIERELGRVRGVLNGPRTIDLDILLYDRLVLDTPQLKIPHPRLFERSFVLEPLKEIEPGLLSEFAPKGSLLADARPKIR